MDQQRWKKISTIIDTVLALDKNRRPAYIKKVCKNNQLLKQEITDLLSYIEKSNTENFLEEWEDYPHNLIADFSQAPDVNPTSAMLGQAVGHYKIKQLIGHGGMGSVFLAERADDAFNRKVALKVLRRGMDTPSNVARFKRERNILANLNHPNIARLLDGGVTEDGLPYLVMEYVNGIPLLKYCNKHQLSIEKRLELFKSICNAVQHAHRNATIHRDLKPSNIYVTNDGVVKVLDFGIAKLLKSNTTDFSAFKTRTGARILTLGYAAPEQLDSSNTITTATDCYTLGILLYELLAGISPFDLKDKTLSKIEKFIRIRTPVKPSTKLEQLTKSELSEIANQRNTIPSAVVQSLSDDLDAIIMKALRKEPDTRYRSVDQLLEDFNRYEESRPLIAQSDTLKYRLRKFIRRNHRVIIGSVSILITILIFGGYHINQIAKERNIAKKEAQKAQIVKKFLVDIYRSSNPQSNTFKGKDISAKQLLLSGEKKIGHDLKNQPDIYAEVLLVIGDAFKGIDAFEKAEKSYRKALSKSSETTHPFKNKLRIYVKLGNLKSKWTKDHRALQPALKARKLLDSLKNPPPELEVSVFSLLGRVNVLVENYEQANSYYEKADSIYISTGMSNSFGYIQMLNGYGKSLIYTSDLEKAEQILLKSNALHRKAFSTPTVTIAKNYKFLGWVYRDMGNFKQSNNYFLKSIDLDRRLTGKESLPTALSMYHLSINYTLAGDFEKAEDLAKKVLRIYQKLLEPTNDYIQRPKKYIAIAKYNLNEYSEAKNILREIIKKRKKLRGKDNLGLAGPSSYLAVVYQKTGHYKKAISLLKKSIRIYKNKLGEYNSRMGRAMIKLATVYRKMNEYKHAHKYLQRVKSIHQKVLPHGNYQQGDFYFEYGKLEQDEGKPQEAQDFFKKAYNIYLENFGKDSKRTENVELYLD